MVDNEATELKVAILRNLEKYGEVRVKRALERFWKEPNIEKIAEILAIGKCPRSQEDLF